MTTVQGGNGQNVHHGKDDRDKGGDIPEVHPVPCCGEDAADGAEAAQALCSFGGEDEFELLDIVHHLGPSHLDAARYRLQDVVMDDRCLEDLGRVREQDTQLAVAVDGYIGDRYRLAATLIVQGDVLSLVLLQLGGELAVAGRGHSIDGHHAVTVLKADFLASHAGLRLRHDDGQAVSHERLTVLGILIGLEDEILGQVDGHGVLVVTQHLDLSCRQHRLQVIGIEVTQLFTIGCQGDITIDKAYLVGAVAVFHTLGGVAELDELLAHGIDDASIDNHR